MMVGKQDIDQLFSVDRSEDAWMSLEEANLVAQDIQDTGGTGAIQDWLRDIIECDGTANEARLAAILRGILLARTAEA